MANRQARHGRLNEKAAMVLGLVLPLVLMIPACIWILRNEAPIDGDPAGYAVRTLGLLNALRELPDSAMRLASPEDWGAIPLARYEFTPPGIVWFAQVFVLLGKWFGSINAGLMASIIVTQWAALVLVFQVLWHISGRNLPIAILGPVVIASTQSFAGLAHLFYVEPLQLLSVTWFLAILALAPRWSRALAASQLLGAASLAMLAKGSSPLYCILPGLVVIWYIIRRRPTQESWGWTRASTLLTLAFVLPMSLAGLAWYSLNSGSVLSHIISSSVDEQAAIWGKQDTYLNTFAYWLGSIPRVFFDARSLQVAAPLVCLAGGAYLLLRNQTAPEVKVFVLVSLLQIFIALAVFSLSLNRFVRYLLPLLPYVAILLCLVVAEAKSPLVSILVVCIFAVQSFQVQSRELRRQPRDRPTQEIVESILETTCPPGRPKKINVLALENGPLGPPALNYVVARDLTNGIPRFCYYVYMGFSYFGEPAATAWEMLQSEGVRYVIIGDPEVYTPKPDAINESLNTENFPLLWRNLQTSGLFRLEGRVPEDPGLLIYRRSGGP